MLKLRLQGSMRDIKWFLKMINRDKRFIKNNPSDPMDIKGADKYKRVSLWIVIATCGVLLSVYGRLFNLYLLVAVSPLPIAAAIGKPTRFVSYNFLKTFLSVVLEAMTDRRKLANGNEWVLGVPGGGKSMLNKLLGIYEVLLSPGDLIFIDPHGEYVELTHALHGQVVTLGGSSGDIINAMDIGSHRDAVLL